MKINNRQRRLRPLASQEASFGILQSYNNQIYLAVLQLKSNSERIISQNLRIGLYQLCSRRLSIRFDNISATSSHANALGRLKIELPISLSQQPVFQLVYLSERVEYQIGWVEFVESRLLRIDPLVVSIAR